MASEEGDRAIKVHQYWRSRGYDVDVRTNYISTAGHPIHAVRSDMVNGLPRNLRPELPVDIAVPVVRDR